MSDLDPREVLLVNAMSETFVTILDQLRETGMPQYLAMRIARECVQALSGIDLQAYYPSAPWEDVQQDDPRLYDVQTLSQCFHLEHDGSALYALLPKHGYQWRTSKGHWRPTERTHEQRLGFVVPGSRSKMLWQSAVGSAVIALEQARQAIEPLAPGERDVLQRSYYAPAELGKRFGVTTRQVNQWLCRGGYQTREPYRRARKRWEPTARAIAEQACIFAPRTLEWLPRILRCGGGIERS